MKRENGKYFTSLLLFGLNGVVASQIALASYQIVWLRTLIGGAMLLAVLLVTGGKFTFFRHLRSLGFLALSGAAMGGSWLFLYEGYQLLGVSLASLAYYCGPVLVMALLPVLFGEKLTRRVWLGFGGVLVGMVLVNGPAMVQGVSPWGLACGALSAVMYAVMVIGSKKSAAIGGLENATLQLVFAWLTVTVFLALRGGLVFGVARGDLGWILALGLLNTGVGCYFYFSAMGVLPVQRVAICGYLEPLSAVVLSALLLRESLSPLQILGAALLIGGAVFSETGKRRAMARQRSAPATPPVPAHQGIS